MAYQVHFPTHLEIDGVPLSTPAWEHLNLQALLGSAAVRGENVVMPGAVGVRPVRRRPTETNYTLDLAIFGDRNWEGVAYPDPVVGLVANLGHLRANVIDPLETVNSVRPATIHLPSGTLVASIQVLGFEVTEAYSSIDVLASMDITVIQGAFL
jgi:hypothetical protein